MIAWLKRLFRRPKCEHNWVYRPAGFSKVRNNGDGTSTITITSSSAWDCEKCGIQKRAVEW